MQLLASILPCILPTMCSTCGAAQIALEPPEERERESERRRIAGEDEVCEDDCETQLPPENLNQVITCLKKSGADINTIKVLQETRETQKAANAPKDLWRELQSTRDKIKNVQSQLDAARDKQDKLKVQFDKAADVVQDLTRKMDALAQSKEDIQAQLSTEEPKSNEDFLEKTLKAIQEKVSKGIPEENTDERRQLYALIFGEQAETVGSSQTQQPHSQGAAEVEGLHPGATAGPRSFGPSGKAHGNNVSEPYAKSGAGIGGATASA